MGRAIQKSPSIAKYYTIEYTRDEKNPKNMADIRWEAVVPEEADVMCGKYFLRTNREKLDETTTWDYYNLIREIECTNYDKFIVMRSHSKCISDYQNVTYLLLISALHNNMVAMTSFHLNVRTNGYQKDFL